MTSSHFSECQGNSADRADKDDEQRRSAPDGEKNQTDQSNTEVTRRVDGARPDWIVERGTEQTNDRCVDAAHHGLRARALPEIVPERQGAEQDQNTGKENADQT